MTTASEEAGLTLLTMQVSGRATSIMGRAIRRRLDPFRPAHVVGRIDPERLGILPPFLPLAEMVGRVKGPQYGFAFLLWVALTRGGKMSK